MALILAVQPDSAQSGLLRQALCDSANAEVVVVDSVDAALEVVDETMPDLVLLDEFTPPRDAENLIAYLRVLPDTHHVQAISVPVIKSSSEPPPSHEESRRYRWLSHLLKEPQRSDAPAGCDPEVFAADVAEYLSRTDAIKSEGYYQKAADHSWQSSDRRRTPRREPGDVPFISAQLVTERADLINVSAGGALFRMEVRPLPRPDAREGRQSESTLTLFQASGEAIRQTGRPVRCRVKPIGQGRVLYEVAFKFDQDLGVLLQSLEPVAPAESKALQRGHLRRVGAR